MRTGAVRTRYGIVSATTFPAQPRLPAETHMEFIHGERLYRRIIEYNYTDRGATTAARRFAEDVVFGQFPAA